MQVTGENSKVTFNAPYNDVTGTQNNQYHYHSNVIPEVDLGPTEKIIRRLRPANMDASHRTECLDGTRMDVLDSIMNWVMHSSSPDQNVLCLHGVAGSGKSTIATSIANRLRQCGLLGAFLFFERDVLDRNDPLLVIRTIAYQIGTHHQQSGAAMASVIEKHPSVCQFPLSSQFQQLLADILPTTPSSPTPASPKKSLRSKFRKLLYQRTKEEPSTRQHTFLVIVIDALDECGTPIKRELLLRTLAELTRGISFLRFIITSRPESDIRSLFSSRPHILLQELDISSEHTTRDILNYLRDRMALVQRRTSYLNSQTGWPGEDKLQSLVTRASGLFIWATTVATFIVNGFDPNAQLDIILSGTPNTQSESALDELYQTALISAGDWTDMNFVREFRSVIGIVLVAQCPLAGRTIDKLRGQAAFQLPCTHIISRLACLVHQQPARLLHPSFADFLFTRSRCGKEYWLFDHDTLHRTLAIQSIGHLQRVLTTNICNLTLSPDSVTIGLPEDVEYACLYWIEHICRVDGADSAVLRLLEVFLFKHLLHWMEAMSVLKMTRHSIGLLQKLDSWLAQISDVEPQVRRLVNDGIRFVQRHAESIETHPLHVYASALSFTPPDTLLYKIFHDPLVHPKCWGLVEQSWSPLLQVLSGHSGYATSVACSPDGSRIVSGSYDKTLRVWDVTSGIEVLPPLTGHTDFVNSVAISPDGTRIVSASKDLTIRRWCASSGLEILPPMRGHTDMVTSAVFSPDGKFIISGSHDKTVRVWDTNIGVEVRRPLEGHSYEISSVSCSQTHIASGSIDKTIRVWDIASGLESIPPLRGHTDGICSVAFSPNGSIIVSGSWDRNICLWNAHSGDQILHPFEGHSDGVLSVSFSPDGTRIISGSNDETVRVWSVTTGTEIIPSLVYNGVIASVAMSPDGTRIVSGSYDDKLQVWDATLSGSISSSECHTSHITSLAFSSDGARLVSGCSDRTVRVWDTTSGVQCLPPLRGHSDWVGSVAFSPEGTRIVSGSKDGTARIWDATTGLELLSLPYESMVSVAFSSDGCHIISRDWLRRQYTWDALLGTRIRGRGSVNPIDFTGEINLDKQSRWITDRITGKYLSKVPSTVVITSQCSLNRYLAVGQWSGNVFLVHFPPRT